MAPKSETGRLRRTPVPLCSTRVIIPPLDGRAFVTSWALIMKTSLRIAASLTLLALVSACNSQPETIDGNTKEETSKPTNANGSPVELPPMMVASHTYRCKDNSLVKVEFFSDKTALIAVGSAAGTKVTQGADGGAYTADGYSVSGPGSEVTLTVPGKGAQSCKA